jgi:CRP-like cAMP-binding protein
MPLRKNAKLELLSRVSLFDQCSKAELARLAQLTEEIDYNKRTVVIREGEKGHEFFVVVSGHLEVSRKGRKLGIVGPGDHVGEFAILSGSPRNATVKALEPVHLLWMNDRAFVKAIDSMPGVWRKIAVALADRAEKSSIK